MTRHSQSLVLWALIALGLVLAGRARAQAEPDGYREAVEQALAEYEARNFEEASTLFARAHSLAPSARTLRGLGMTAYELRRYPESIGYLEQSLAAEAKPLEGALRTDTERLLARARGFVGTVAVELSPASATLFVDGTEVPSAGPLRLGVGDHELEARADGYVVERRKLRLASGEVQRVRLALAPVRTVAETRDRAPTRKRPWLWTGIGLAAAGVVGAAVTGAVLATRDRDRTEVVASGTTQTPPGAAIDVSGSLR